MLRNLIRVVIGVLVVSLLVWLALIGMVLLSLGAPLSR